MLKFLFLYWVFISAFLIVFYFLYFHFLFYCYFLKKWKKWTDFLSMSIVVGTSQLRVKRNRGLSVLESPVNLSGPKSCFAFVVFAFKIKVSIILKIIQWNYQLTKHNWLVCALGTVLLIQQVWILKFAFVTERFAALSRNRPQQRLFFYFVT